ncbi:MAG: HAD family hydrolase [Promethearchaeota archaeon]
MKIIKIPNYGELKIKNVVFDINGTIQFKGKIEDDLIIKFQELKKIYDVYLVSSDTRGNLKDLAEKLGVDFIKINPEEKNKTDAEAKEDVISQLGESETIAIGNGNNDYLMLKRATLGIVIIGFEGASIKSILNADLAFTNPLDVIDFLLDDTSIISTLRI